jgi:hypothetical protein
MEDEMQIPNSESLAFTAIPSAVCPTGKVSLAVGLTEAELTALKDSKGTIDFAVISPASAPTPVQDPTNPCVATWSAPKQKKLGLGAYVFRAQVCVGDSIRCGTARVFVFNSADLPNPVQIYAEPSCVQAGCAIKLTATFANAEDERMVQQHNLKIVWAAGDNATIIPDPNAPMSATLDTTSVQPGFLTITGHLAAEHHVLHNSSGGPVGGHANAQVQPRPFAAGDTLQVALQRSAAIPTDDLGLWAAIRSHGRAISFGGLGLKGSSRALRGYQGFIERVLCEGNPELGDRAVDQCGPDDLHRIARRARHLPMHGMAAYELLKTATEIFLLWNCGVVVREHDALGNRITTDNEELARSGLDITEVKESLTRYLGRGRLPYIERVVGTAFPGYVSVHHGRDSVFENSVFCTGVLTPRADCVCLIELIWSYWHEEAMLVQTMNAITQRFQNVRAMSERDPLAHVTIDPLRPLNNLLWGYVQDEPNRLSVKRRGAEYDHEYGITLRGKAITGMRPADSRSKFLEGFHNLLHMCSVFYKEDNDTTVIADGFPLLNALKEVHLLLAQGAHNQFGDLPWTARVEMLMQQWLLARPEMRDFLQSRPMVPYTEAWMPQVDTMKTLQGWSDVTVTHFHDLAAFGEQIVLSIRYGDWIDLNDENYAKNWARYWRPEIQSYIHAYRTVTGVDLTNPDTVDSTMPAVHLQRRLSLQRAR